MYLGVVDFWLHVDSVLEQPPARLGDQLKVVGGEVAFDATDTLLGGQLVAPGPDEELRSAVPAPPGGAPADAVQRSPRSDSGPSHAGADVAPDLKTRDVAGNVGWRASDGLAGTFEIQVVIFRVAMI